MSHQDTPVSDWIARWTPLLNPTGRALDLACGSGRHSIWLAGQGMKVTAVDRDETSLVPLKAQNPAIQTLQADLESQPWPLAGETFDAVVVTNYLWRPLWPHILGSLAPGGVLLCETFAHGNASVGRPSRPDFLLQQGELLRVCSGLRVVAFEDGFLPHPERFVQRICAFAISPSDESGPPKRCLLNSAG